MASLSIPDPVFHRLQSNAAARRMSLEAYLAELAGKDAPPRSTIPSDWPLGINSSAA